jgi:hypothetical protein
MTRKLKLDAYDWTLGFAVTLCAFVTAWVVLT